LLLLAVPGTNGEGWVTSRLVQSVLVGSNFKVSESVAQKGGE
jgi:hypothetical protein